MVLPHLSPERRRIGGARELSLVWIVLQGRKVRRISIPLLFVFRFSTTDVTIILKRGCDFNQYRGVRQLIAITVNGRLSPSIEVRPLCSSVEHRLLSQCYDHSQA